MCMTLRKVGGINKRTHTPRRGARLRSSLNRREQLGGQAVESAPCLPDLHRYRENGPEAAGLLSQTPMCA